MFDSNLNIYDTEDKRLLLYTSCTRALHVLNIHYLEEIESLLNNKF